MQLGVWSKGDNSLLGCGNERNGFSTHRHTTQTCMYAHTERRAEQSTEIVSRRVVRG